VKEVLARYRPWTVLNAAGRTPDEALDGKAAGQRNNVEGIAVLAVEYADAGIPLVYFSTAQVFYGRLGRPYAEEDPLSPTSFFGESKAEAERRLLHLHPSPLVVRLGHHVEAEATVPPPFLDPAALSHLPDLAQVVPDLLVASRGASGISLIRKTGPR
jgi:dTDP-4-dehydrorhamnose reductase